MEYKKVRAFLIVSGLSLVLLAIKFPRSVAIFIFAAILINTGIRFLIESTLHERVDIEFLTFSICAASYTNGFFPGMVLALGGMAGEIIVYRKFKAYYAYVIAQYLLVAIIAALMRNFSFLMVGFITVAFVNIFSYIFEDFVINRYPLYIIAFRAANIIFNFLFFTLFSGIVLKLIS